MPKETFYYESAMGDARRLEVAWYKAAGDVTVGAQCQTFPGDDWHVTRVPLSADQIDDLIRALRRAKRQSFGEEITSGVVVYDDQPGTTCPE